MSAKINFAYRSNIGFQLLTVLFQVYLLKVIWTAVSIQQNTINPMHLQTLISYLTLANLQTWIIAPVIPDILQQRIRTGDIALDIAKPVNFLGQLLAQQFGSTLSLIPFLFLTFPLALVAGGMQLPPSVAALVFYLLSLILSYLVVSLIGMLIGLICFWTLEATGIQMVYYFINQLFAGTLIPLSLFPPVLRTIATFLPFQTVAFLPVSIYLGQLQGTDILSALAVQLFWVGALYLLVRLVWHKAQRHIMLQGG